MAIQAKMEQGSLLDSFRESLWGGAESLQWECFLEFLGSIFLLVACDRWVWSGVREFFVASTRYWMRILSRFLRPRLVGVTWCLSRLMCFCGIFSLDKLPTRYNLDFRGLDVPSLQCPLCDTYIENNNHLFFSC